MSYVCDLMNSSLFCGSGRTLAKPIFFVRQEIEMEINIQTLHRRPSVSIRFTIFVGVVHDINGDFQ